MTRREAKNELYPLKDMNKDMRAVMLEIERLMTVATKMTSSLDGGKVKSGDNRTEAAIIKANEYKEKLSKLLLENLEYKNRCLNKVSQIEKKNLRSILIYYFFQDNTLEKTAELIGKSPRWTYDKYLSALDEYAKIP